MQAHTLLLIGSAALAVVGLPVLFIVGLELAAYFRYKLREYRRNYRRILNEPASRFETRKPAP